MSLGRQQQLDPFRTGGVIIWRGDARTFQFKYVSQEAEEILGYPVSRWIDEPTFWIEHIHPDDRDWAPSFCARATADCEDHDFEYRMIASDGRVVWLRDIVRVSLEDGVPVELYGVMVDITDRRQLLEQVATYTEVFDNTQVGLAVMKLEDPASAESLKLLYLNDAASVQVGTDLQPYLGQRLVDVFPQAFSQGIAEQFYQVIRTGKAQNLGEVRYGDERIKAGVYSIRAFPILEDRVGVSFEDVTEAALEHEELERRVEERTSQLKESEEKYRTVVDTMSDGVLSIDAESRILFANRAVSEIFGYSAEELEGTNLVELMPRDLRELHRKALQAYLDTGVRNVPSGHLEGSGRHKSGREFPLSVSIGEGRHRGQPVFIGVVRDITERRQFEIELMQAREAALQSARMKSEFLANMSHEIRTPMNGVIGMTGLLLDTDLTEEQTEFAETIRASAENLLVVINDILDFSKIEAGKFRLEVLDFDLLRTVEEVSELLAAHAAKKGLELAVFVHRDTPTHLRGDPARLWQVLMNLVNNALKFTEQGEVVLRVTPVFEEGDRVVLRFEVVDTGVGIGEKEQSQLFLPFSQVDGSSTRTHGGTGLGLVISKELVNLMGGKIGVQSELGKGSTFWFTATFDKQSGEDRKELPSVLADKKALIVDDNLTNLRILRHQLQAWGIEVVSASSGMSALEKLEEQAFELAILDMQMPEMDGLELAQRIRSDSRFQDMRLILMTSVDQSQSQGQLRSAGLDANLRKPVTRAQLYNCVCQALGRRVATQHTGAWRKTSIPEVHEEAAGAVDISPLKVMLVEDNPINRRVTSLQLHKLGIEVDAVVSGADALDRFKEGLHDVILMDCQMPGMNGFETTAKIREMDTGNHRPVILALTANVMEGDRQACLEAGMDDYLGKPLSFPDLKASLEKWGGKILAERDA